MSLLQGALSEAGRFGGGAQARRGAKAAQDTSLPDRLRIALDAERGRWFLWLPVFFGAGAALYLAWPEEPPLALAGAAVIFASAMRIFLCSGPLRLIFSTAALMLALGFAAAKLHALRADAPVLNRTLTYAQLEGWVESVERLESRHRLTLRLIRIDNLPREKTPLRARVSMSGKGDPPRLGSAIRLRATLMPPPEPALPGGFDFARFYWFKGIGASGYAMGAPEPLAEAGPPPAGVRAATAIGAMRHSVADRIAAVLDGDRAAIAKALAVGERAEISEETKVALRDSGLAHVIAISGFHMALIAGGMFWLIRAVLALVPGIALRYPIRVWAALGALVIAAFYLALSGAAVTAIRAFIMVSIAFLAVMLNRPAISLRNLAIAGLVILAIMPQSLLDAGFQMSFAATAALIAYYERRTGLRRFEGWPALAAVPLVFLTEIALTTIVASLAVDPFAAYHFHRIAIYSVVGNILAIPVVTMVIMPLTLAALALMPFGLEALPLSVMAYGLDAMIAGALFTASLPGAALPVPVFADGAMTLIVAGGLWLIIWAGRWRWMGLAAIGLGLAIAPFGGRADVWVDREGKLVAIRNAEGLIETPPTRKAGFSLERWMEADGDGREASEARGGRAFQCDDSSCVALVKGRVVAFVTHPSALADDCRRADVVIADFPLRAFCAGPSVVIDRLDLMEKGAHMVMIGPERLEVSTAADKRGERPWVLQFRRRQTVPETVDETGADQ